MKRLKPFDRLFMLLAATLTMGMFASSCGDDIYETYETYYIIDNTDEALCNKLWIEDHYVTPEGQAATYQLRFDADGRGQELTSWAIGTGTNTIDRQISWRWTDDSKECIQIIYNDGTAQYLENVWVRDHYLSAEIDGTTFTFVDASHRY